eukprot:7225089-Alexandrium_andersonii.AAC.1
MAGSGAGPASILQPGLPGVPRSGPGLHIRAQCADASVDGRLPGAHSRKHLWASEVGHARRDARSC